MRNNNIGNDLKAMAQDVMDIGVHYVRSGREWLDERRHEMTGTGGEHSGEQRSPPPPGGPRHRHGPPHRDHRAHRGGGGGGPESYLDPGASGSPGFVSPGDTQRGTAGQDYWRQRGPGSAYGRSDYLQPGAAGGYAGIGPKSYRRSDERINEEWCERRTHDHDVDASDIEVKVAEGVVTLTGSVRDRWMKHRAEDIADSCNGVHSVENRIRVQSAATGGAAASSTATGGSTSTGGSPSTAAGSRPGYGSATSHTASTTGGTSAGTGGSGTGTGSTSGSSGPGNTSSNGPAGGKPGV